jgi:hypothetical protein
MQEFLYANNIIITGSWLPYEVFDNEGIQYVKIDDISELYLELKKVIDSDIQTFDTSKNSLVLSIIIVFESHFQVIHLFVL